MCFKYLEWMKHWLLDFYNFLFGTSGQQCISTPRNTLTLLLDKRYSSARTDLCLLFTLKTLKFPHSEPFFRFLFHIYQLMTRISFSSIKEVNQRSDLLRRRANVGKVSFPISFRWPIRIINPVEKNKKKNSTSSGKSSLIFALLVTNSV